jgi:hypothetical protein
VRLPGATLAAVTESGHAVASAPGIKSALQDGADVVIETGAGRYAFAYPAEKLAAELRKAAEPERRSEN